MALSRGGARDEPIELKLPKPTLQKLDAKEDIEHFLATFERIAQQQKWPKAVWATQLAGLLTGKAMAGESHGRVCKHGPGGCWDIRRSEAGYPAEVRGKRGDPSSPIPEGLPWGGGDLP